MIGRAVESLRLRALDAVDAVRDHDPLVPPRLLRGFVGDSDFRATGDDFVTLCVGLAGLRPEERVLDVGSGIGRMARPLAGFLRPPGGYEGFDVVPDGIAWCRRHYAAHAHFRFQPADVRNGLYRPDAGVPAREYTFPYADASFDFAFATSVFTDSLETPEDAVAYEEAWLRDRLAAHGLGLDGPIRLGTWSGLADADTRQFQDVVLARPS